MKSMQIQKLLYLDVFIVSLIVLGCFLAAMVTNQMVTGRVTHPAVKATNYGDIQFGLVWGTKQYNYGYGLRDEQQYIVYDEYEDVHSTGVVMTTLCFVAVASVFMIVSIVFALMNAITVPSKDIHGILGLFVWNGIAATFSFLAIIFYMGLFYGQIRDNIESSDEEGFIIDESTKTRVGYSFWLLFTGMVLVMTNLAVIFLVRKVKYNPELFKKPKAKDTPLDDSLNVKQINDAFNY